MDEAALHDLLSGRRRDLTAKFIRVGLALSSSLYTAATRVRNLAYDTKVLRTHHVRVPVISLGNITTGGTGKTPLAAWLANWLITANRKPGLISRGYRSLNRDSSQATSPDNLKIGNDEKLVLDRLCPNVPHLQQQDRVASAKRAVADFGCDVLVLDDGFQHRRLGRDLDLILVDALQPWGYGHILPRGLLRESLTGLRRADLILVTRADQCSEAQRLILRATLMEFRGSDECVEVAFQPTQLVDLDWQAHSLKSVAGKSIFAFCGIGNPTGFRKTIEGLGVSCPQLRSFPDHHHYDANDLKELAEQARECSAEAVLTTQKDLVKIRASDWHGPPLFAVEIGVRFIKGGDLLESRLRHLTTKSADPFA